MTSGGAVVGGASLGGAPVGGADTTGALGLLEGAADGTAAGLATGLPDDATGAGDVEQATTRMPIATDARTR